MFTEETLRDDPSWIFLLMEPPVPSLPCHRSGLPERRFASDSFSLDGLEYPDKIIRPINGLDRHSLGSSWRHLPADEQPTLASRSYVICLALYFFP